MKAQAVKKAQMLDMFTRTSGVRGQLYSIPLRAKQPRIRARCAHEIHRSLLRI